MGRSREFIIWGLGAVVAAGVIYLLYLFLWLGGGFGEGEGIATLTRSLKTVSRRSANSIAWADAKTQAKLQENDAVRTGKASLAEITFSPDNIITLSANTQIIIKSIRQKRGKYTEGSLLLDEGTIRFVNTAPNKGLTIRTSDTVELDVSGSQGSISKFGDKGLQLALKSGQAQVKTAKGKMILNSQGKQGTTIELNDTAQGMQLKVVSGKAKLGIDGREISLNTNQGVGLQGGKLSTYTLPPAPSVITQELEVSAFDMQSGKATLKWEAAKEKVKAYSIQIASKNAPSQAPIKVSAQGATYSPTGLSPGHYEWRVSAINPAGMEGNKSPPALLSIIDTTQFLPPQPISPKKGARFSYLVNSLAVGFSWSKENPSGRYRFQLARSSRFTPKSIIQDSYLDSSEHKTKLRQGEYFWRVASIGGKKVGGDFSQTFSLSIQQELPIALFLTSPKKYELAFDDEIIIDGKVTPGNRVFVRVLWAGQQEIKTNPDGSFKYRMQIFPGKNKFTFTVRNKKGKISRLVHEAIRIPQGLLQDPDFIKEKASLDRLNGAMIDVYAKIQSASKPGSKQAETIRKLLQRQTKIERDIHRQAAKLEVFIQ